MRQTVCGAVFHMRDHQRPIAVENEHDDRRAEIRLSGLEEMSAALADRPCLMLAAAPRSAIGGVLGADQAAFNLAIHMDLVQASIHQPHPWEGLGGAAHL